MDKNSWRARLRGARNRRGVPEVVSLGDLFRALGFGKRGPVRGRLASYVPLGLEPVPLVEEALVPRLFGDDGKMLPPGRWGFGGALEVARPGWPAQPPCSASPDDVDLVLVPALAVDRGGVRLGKGGGWYDRALLGLAAHRIAVVYDDEVYPSGTLPQEPHDLRMDGVVTPTGFELF